MIKTGLTVPEKLLLAALEARKKSETFSAEDLVVSAWTMYPDTFGLSGYSDRFPDSNRVLTNIMGTKGMRGKGWLRKVGEKKYRISPAGLAFVETLVDQDAELGQRGALRAELDRHASSALARILATSASRKIVLGESDQVSLNEAFAFWDVTVRSNAQTLISRLADVDQLLARALGSSQATGSLRITGQDVAEAEVARLQEAHLALQERFRSELDYIRKRTDERVDRKSRAF